MNHQSILNNLEKSTERYIEAENILIELLSDPWYKRMFYRNKIIEFLKSRKKYKF